MKDRLIILRKQLTSINAIFTTVILIIITMIAFSLCKSEIKREGVTSLQNDLKEVKYRLKVERTVSQAWLAQKEADNKIIISISNNGVPFLYRRIGQERTSREELINKAKDIAVNKYGFNLYDRENRFSDGELSGIEMETEHKEHYMFAISLLEIEGQGYELIILKNLVDIDAQLYRLIGLFLGMDVIGIILLGIFSFWFSGKAIIPIKESRQKQNEFIAAASHELKAPLAVLQTNASALNYKKPEEQGYLIHSIESECQRMARLVSDLLTLTKSDAMNWQIKIEPNDLETIVLDVYEMFYDAAAKESRGFNAELPDESLPLVPCDEERIKQVLIILIDNALSYTEKGTPLEIELKKKGKKMQVQVIDHGKGLTEEQKKHVFERFYRVDQARHEKNHSGLGLSIAYEIMKLHKGRLYVKDTEGGGCTFTIELVI